MLLSFLGWIGDSIDAAGEALEKGAEVLSGFLSPSPGIVTALCVLALVYFFGSMLVGSLL